MITIIPKPPALNFRVFFPLYKYNNPSSSFLSVVNSLVRLKFPYQRRRFLVQASSLVLPLLPFPTDQVLKYLFRLRLKPFIYTKLDIALLEESLFQKDKLFVHSVLDPIGFSGTSGEASFAATYGCLVLIEKVERLELEH